MKATRGRAGERAAGSVIRTPVVRPAPLRLAVFDALRELIINREFQPGEHLGEAELAEQLGVSRQPVREAFQQLQAEGWVDLRPGQGAFVHSPSDKEVDDLLAVRTMLESQSAQLAALNRRDSDVEHLWQLWEQGVRAVESGHAEAMTGANAVFHSYVMNIAGNTVLTELGKLVDRRVRWHYQPLAQARSKDSWEEHAEVIRAIADGDSERAGRVMGAHTERTRQASHHEDS